MLSDYESHFSFSVNLSNSDYYIGSVCVHALAMWLMLSSLSIAVDGEDISQLPNRMFRPQLLECLTLFNLIPCTSTAGATSLDT